MPKNWCFKNFVLEKTIENPLGCKEIKLVHPKGNKSWIFIGRTDAEAEALILWSPDVKNWLTGTDPGVGKDWRQEEKGTTEDEMVEWHHWLNGHEFEQTMDTVKDREAYMLQFMVLQSVKQHNSFSPLFMNIVLLMITLKFPRNFQVLLKDLMYFVFLWFLFGNGQNLRLGCLPLGLKPSHLPPLNFIFF